MPDPVPPGTLETLIAAAQSAATSSNMQWWSADRRHRPGQEQGAGRDRRQPEAHRAVPAVPRLGGRHVAQRAHLAGRARSTFETLPWLETFMVACIDAALAAQNAVVAAESLGPAHGLYRRHAQRPGPGRMSCWACRRKPSSCSASASAMPTDRPPRTRSSRACRSRPSCITSAMTPRRRGPRPPDLRRGNGPVLGPQRDAGHDLDRRAC